MKSAGRGRICLFGGTFDPVHLGHLAMAELALRFVPDARILFLPSASPPHKQGPCKTPKASFEDRLAMVRIAVSGHARFAVSDREGRASGPVYTVDLLREIREEVAGEDVLLFLIGSDWISGLAQWKEIDEVFRLCRFLVAPRSGFDRSRLESMAALLGPDKTRLLDEGWMDGPAVDVSSSEIRDRAARGEGIGGLVPKGVESHILRTGLYLLKG